MFARFTRAAGDALGSSAGFFVAFASMILWAAAGPFCGFSATWMLVVNTGTTIITFLALFLVQHTQNADTCEIKAMIRELMRAVPEADDSVIVVEPVKG